VSGTSDPTNQECDRRRRALISLPLALAGTGSAWAQVAPGPGAAATAGLGAVRMALLLGNRIYPKPFDLPPVHKNVRDLTRVLELRGFKVTSAVDLEPATLRRAIQGFAAEAKGAPPDATVLYYFTGHGMQVDAENLMLGAGIAPDAREDVLLGASLHLQRDVIEQLPGRPLGQTIAIIDACRSSLSAVLKSADGLNQVEAPPGCMIVFSTAAGKPAIAPAVETLNTFYTGSLVKILESAADELSFSDVFRLVKIDVQTTMQNHPVAAIRQVAQVPFIAENLKVRFRLSPKPIEEVTAPQPSAAEETELWRTLEESMWPADVLRLAQDYLERYPQSKLSGSAQVARAGASDAIAALNNNEVRLYRSAFQPKTTQAQWLVEWRKAARGDKDAAARIARAYINGAGDIAADPNRYQGWLQYAAALGNGIACYELAVYYRRQGQSVQAAQYETRARDLGYTPPRTLDNVRK
jgi:hypothetical protein